MDTGPHSGKRTHKRQLTHALGFSLIELLIVVAILAVLAAVIAPQFSSSTLEAQESALRSNLSSVRSAIAMYHRDHGGVFPGVTTSIGAACTGTTGSGTANSEQSLKDQLTRFTNAAGESCTVKAVGFDFGPYLATGFPANSVTNNSTIAISAVGNLSMTGNATPAGWKYDYVIGKLIADDATYQAW